MLHICYPNHICTVPSFIWFAKSSPIDDALKDPGLSESIRAVTEMKTRQLSSLLVIQCISIMTYLMESGGNAMNQYQGLFIMFNIHRLM